MNLEYIQKEWEKDSHIDDVLLDKHSLEIPKLHAKYINILNEIKLLKKKKEIELRQSRTDAWLFYMGKGIPEGYENIHFSHKVMKSDVDQWINVDERVTKNEMQLEYYNVMIDTLTDIVKQISNRTFQIKNAVEAKKFYSGYN